MVKLGAGLIFFLSFFKISLFHQNAYVSILFGILGLAVLIVRGDLQRAIHAFGFAPIVALLVLASYLLVVDAFSASILENKARSFSVRAVSLFFIGIFPAYLIARMIDARRQVLLRIVEGAFWIQLAFWIATYFSPDLKEAIYRVMGMAESANLRDYNLLVRGFGLSTEVNYTSPFVMSLVCFLLIRKVGLSLVTFVTQLVNSGLVIFSILVGVVLSKTKIHKKLVVLLVFLLVVVIFGDDLFVRFFAEFEGGESRTVDTLLGEHWVILNSGVFEALFGTGRYVLSGEEAWRSDIGWIILYNFGGVVAIILFSIFIALLSISAFGFGWTALAWIVAGFVLNTKGIVFGPNAYLFMTFLLCFCKDRETHELVAES